MLNNRCLRTYILLGFFILFSNVVKAQNLISNEIDSLKKLVAIQQNDSLKVVAKQALGWAYFKSGNLKEVQPIVNQLKQQCLRNNWQFEYHNVRRLEGGVFARTGQFDSTLAILDKAIICYKKFNHDSLLGVSYRNKGVIYQVTGRADLAAEQAILALQQARKINSEAEIAASKEIAIISQTKLSQLNDSLIIEYDEVIDIYKKRNEFLKYSNASINKSSWLLALGKGEEAITILIRVAKELEKEKEQTLLAKTYNTIGTTYGELGMDIKGQEYFRKAIQLCRKNDDVKNLSLAARFLSISFENIQIQKGYTKDRMDSLMKYSKISERAGMKSKNINFVFTVLCKRSEQLMKYLDSVDSYQNQNIDSAKVLLLNAKSLKFPDSEVPYNYTDYWLSKVKIQFKEGQYRECKKNSKEALKIVKTYPKEFRLLYKKILLGYLADISIKENNTQDAIKYLSQLNLTKDSLYQSDIANAVATAGTKFETKKKEAKNKLLQANLDKKSANQRLLWISLLGLGLIGLIVSLYLNQKRKVATKNLELEKQNFMNVLEQKENTKLQGILDALEDERKRIAQDLHDRVGSILSTVKLQFSHFNDRMDDSDQGNKDNFNKVYGLLDQSITEVRQVSHNMISGVLADFGLMPALYDLKDAVEQGQTLSVSVHGREFKDRLPKNIEINLYRVIQELMNNTIKHAQAKQIEISLSKNEEEILIVYMDDGKGMASDAKYDGIGLANIHARVEKLGGNVTIDSIQGAGFNCVIKIPLYVE